MTPSNDTERAMAYFADEAVRNFATRLAAALRAEADRASGGSRMYESESDRTARDAREETLREVAAAVEGAMP